MHTICNLHIYSQIESLLPSIVEDLHANCGVQCAHSNQPDKVQLIYTALINSVQQSASICIKSSHVGQNYHPKCIAGWNLSAKVKHELARTAFLQWRASGSPKDGPEFSQMRLTRLAFKYAFRDLKRDKNRLKANKLASPLLDQDPNRFWSIIKHEIDRGSPLPQSLGGSTGSVNISAM